MTRPEINNFKTIADLMIQRYERYLPTAFDESMTLLQKMNKIIEYLNQVGKLTTDTVLKWNEVAEWVMNDGLNESVIGKIDELVDSGEFKDLLDVSLLKIVDDLLVEFDTTVQEIENARQGEISLGDNLTGVKTNIDTTVQEIENARQGEISLGANLTEIKNDLSTHKADISINVKNFGAKGDGVTDDTQAIQTAFEYSTTQRKTFVPAGGSNIGTIPLVMFPKGHYLISDEIVIDGRSKIQSLSGSIIEQTVIGKKIFKCLTAFDIIIEGIKFLKGTNALYFSNENVDQTRIDIKNCEFQLQEDYSIYTMGLGYPADPTNYHMSCNITFTKCRFTKPRRVFHNVCDMAILKDCWVFISSSNFDLNTSAFTNLYGTLQFDNMFGVPSGLNTIANSRWIDNHNTDFYAVNSRFGGEDGGIPIVYHLGDRTWENIYPYMGSSIVIENSKCYSGLNDDPNNGVINIVNSVPKYVRIQGCKIVRNIFVNSGGLDLDTYFPNNNTRLYSFILTPNNITSSFTDTLPQLKRYESSYVNLDPINNNIINILDDNNAIIENDIMGGLQVSGRDTSNNAGGVRSQILTIAEGTAGGVALVFKTTKEGSKDLIERMRIKNNGEIIISGSTICINTTKTPTSATALGTKGDMCWDSEYLYMCVDTNTWKRTPISTW